MDQARFAQPAEKLGGLKASASYLLPTLCSCMEGDEVGGGETTTMHGLIRFSMPVNRHTDDD